MIFCISNSIIHCKDKEFKNLFQVFGSCWCKFTKIQTFFFQSWLLTHLITITYLYDSWKVNLIASMRFKIYNMDMNHGCGQILSCDKVKHSSLFKTRFGLSPFSKLIWSSQSVNHIVQLYSCIKFSLTCMRPIF